MNNSSKEGGAGAGTRVGIKAGTSSRPGVGLQDGAEEVLPEWELSTEPRSLASSSSTGSRKRRFRQGKQQGQESPAAISVDDLIESVSSFSSKQADWLIKYRAFRIVK